tara:strand:+ start:780 stop:1379 length:600 start_codon:yes stop_codon:yes gene_type:complete
MQFIMTQISRFGDNTMTTDLEECTEKLLRTPTSINKWIEIADKHMQTKRTDPVIFSLPRAHEFLSPMISVFQKDIEAFLDYIIMLRDNFSKGDKTWEDVQKVYRKINGRHVQAIRRGRASRACAKAQELYGETDYHSRLQWVSDLEHKWANRRLDFLDGYRAKYKTDRIDTETRKEALIEFWNMIDTEIYEGRNIPPWN